MARTQQVTIPLSDRERHLAADDLAAMVAAMVGKPVRHGSRIIGTVLTANLQSGGVLVDLELPDDVIEVRFADHHHPPAPRTEPPPLVLHPDDWVHRYVIALEARLTPDAIDAAVQDANRTEPAPLPWSDPAADPMVDFRAAVERGNRHFDGR